MTKNLGGKWAVRQATGADPLAAAGEKEGWMDARVPGCVHLDLMAAGRIPDPFYGLNELDVRWVEDQDWLYARTFRCPEKMLKAERVDMVCEGLDTFATVLLNGEEIGRADNMFCSWRWDVTKLLKGGPNRLEVFFDSSIRVARSLMKEHGALLEVGFEAARAYMRKEQCATGWDWGPRLNSCGIWLPICLHAYDGARIADVYAPVDWSDPEKPVIKLQVEVDALRGGKAALEAELRKGRSVETAEFGGSVKKGLNTVRCDIPVTNPKLWWPAGQGQQNLYRLKITGAMDGKPLDGRTLEVGLRRVELRREKDAEGESFIICINDRPVFCKGANWIPADSFLPRLTPERYEDLIRKAANANMNMLRVWGGGIYETDQFYQACDRLGVMVWQDFMFTCACYPENLEPFMASVRREAEQNVRRLRNRPSLVLWCGNNENHQGYEEWWHRPDIWGGKIYDGLLPEVCEKLDPQRPYWPGSPYGGEHANCAEAGDRHVYSVWGQWMPPEHYRKESGRFISEFGMQAPPCIETIHKYVPAAERHMQSRTMTHHNKAEFGTEKLYGYLAGRFRVPADFEDCVYLMQLSQGEAIKTAVEHWRACKFRTAGTLFWQMNDCWPVASWSCVDYEGCPKALYYYAKRFFAPVLPVILRAGGGLSVNVVNDRPKPFAGTLVCGMADLAGVDIWTAEAAAELPANAVREVLAREDSELGLTERARQYFWCKLLEGKEAVSANSWFFMPYKHVALPLVDWEVNVAERGEHRFEITLESSAFAKGVWLRMEGMRAEFEDNFFDAFESVPVTVGVTTENDADADSIARRLKIRTVADVR